MIPRSIADKVNHALGRQAAVALIGPRQVGKTTLALMIANKPDFVDFVYLDLESRRDRNKLQDAAAFFMGNQEKLVILDEIYRTPELFQELRGVIDDGKRHGLRTGRFLMLGSASMDLLRQSSESLAGRIAYVEMGPFHVLEMPNDEAAIKRLWIRGGFPDSYLSETDASSLSWRDDFIRTYLEREIPLFGPRVPAETMDRLWTMLAHNQGGTLNASRLAASLSISTQSVNRYIDLLCDLLLVRRLPPLMANVGKRLVKSPKVYIRDSGLTHALLGIDGYNTLAGHPVVGASWEGFVIENLLTVIPERTLPSFYRTATGSEMDLVLELPGGRKWAIEIKLGLSAKPEKGFYQACEDIQPDRSFIVYSGDEHYPVGEKVEIISLRKLMQALAQFSAYPAT